MPRYTYDPVSKTMIQNSSNTSNLTDITKTVKNDNKLTAEDRALFRSIYESYDPEEVEKFISESHIASVVDPQSSHGQTPGTTEFGLKGALRALPSFIISFLISPAATLLQYFGAAHERAEKRWLKTRINPVRWADFVATPNAKKEEIKKKIEEEMARNVEYYIATLANGEIIRVIGATTLEAREMVETVEQKIYFKRGEKMLEDLQNNSSNPEYKTWRVIFDDGEVTYINGTEKDRATQLKLAQKDKNELVEGFKSVYAGSVIKYSGVMGKDTEFVKYPIAAPKADDIVTLDTQYQVINEENYKNYKIIKADRISTWESSYKKYIIQLGDVQSRYMFNFNLYVSNNEDLFKILTNAFYKDDKMKVALNACDKAVDTIIDGRGTNGEKNDVGYYEVLMSNGDTMILPAVEEKPDSDIVFQGGSSKSNSYRTREEELKKLSNDIAENLWNAINADDISKETKTYYKKYSGSTRGNAVYHSHKWINAAQLNLEGFRYINIANNPNIIDAKVIDSRTKDEEQVKIDMTNRNVKIAA